MTIRSQERREREGGELNSTKKVEKAQKCNSEKVKKTQKSKIGSLSNEAQTMLSMT